MNVDVAVLGGGPAGYTAAIRAAQLGANVACIEREPALGGTCLRVGCIPTKAWCRARTPTTTRETFAKLGVQVGEPTLDFGTVASWKDAVVDQMTGGVASLFKANGAEWVKGDGTFTSPTTIGVEGAEEVSFTSAIVATGRIPSGRRSRASTRRGASTRPAAQTEILRRLVILGGGIIGREFASIFDRFGTEVTIVEMLPHLIPLEDEDASKELQKAFKKRSIALHLEKQCTQVDDHGEHLTAHFGDGETVDCDLMLVAAGRAAPVDGLGLEAAGVSVSSTARDRHGRPAADERPAHLRGVGDVAGTGSLRTPDSARARSPRRTRRATRRPSAIPPCHGRSTRSRGGRRRPHRGAGPRAARRRRRRRPLPVGRDRARGASGQTTGWEDDPRAAVRRAARRRHRRAACHRPDRRGRRGARRGVDDETVADGVAPHPTLAEA